MDGAAAPLRPAIVQDIRAIDAAAWNALVPGAPPFVRHEFLACLEESGSVGPGTGWLPAHVALTAGDGRLVGAMPMYRKSDSWGEFVFDWGWAEAYRRAGLRYYPKLVVAAPFTPATGPHLLCRADAAAAGTGRALLDAALAHARDLQASSLHVLFPTGDEARDLEARGLLLRKDCQFHWFNRGYGGFDDFLGEFTAEKRKKAKRERRRVAEAGIVFDIRPGGDVDAALWRELMPLYASSFWRRGRDPYINERFFLLLSQALPESLLVIIARHHRTPVAVAICLRSADTLYGRYWGTSGDYHSLHFETCYYQGIEYCIRHGLRRFEPGTQGEHKITRGFVPAETLSAHWLAHPRFAAAVDDYLQREREQVDLYMDEARSHVPYRDKDG
jgi:predicted N-acyltransferase